MALFSVYRDSIVLHRQMVSGLVELCFAMATVLARIANSVASYSQLGTE